MKILRLRPRPDKFSNGNLSDFPAKAMHWLFQWLTALLNCRRLWGNHTDINLLLQRLRLVLQVGGTYQGQLDAFRAYISSDDNACRGPASILHFWVSSCIIRRYITTPVKHILLQPLRYIYATAILTYGVLCRGR